MGYACCVIIPALLSLFPSSDLRGQANNPPLFSQPTKTVQPVPENSSAIETDEEGNIYLLQTNSHKLSKIYANRGYDSIQTIGGKGIKGEGFNQPSQILAQNRQTIYLLDQMNRRLVLLNTNIKVTREINFLELEAGPGTEMDDEIFPVVFAAATSGELFLLNQNDHKIYKLNTRGELENIFGGLDYGAGSLSDPVEMIMDEKNFLYISDTLHQKVSVYDLFGVYQFTIYPESDFRWERMLVFGNYLLCFNERKVFFKEMITKHYFETEVPKTDNLVDIAVGRKEFYLLFENKVNLYPLK